MSNETKMRDLIEALRDALVEAHDTHIYDDDDEHPDDCGYCALVAESDAILGPDPMRPVVAHVGSHT